MALHPPSTALRSLEEIFPIISSPRPKPINSDALRLLLWVRLRESKLLSQRKRQRNSNNYPPCQTATLPHNLLPPSSHFLRVPFSPGTLPSSRSRKTKHSMNPSHQNKHLDPQHHFLHRILKRQNAKSLEVFREQGFPFWQSPLTNTDRFALIALFCLCKAEEPKCKKKGRRIHNTKYQKN